MDIKRVKNFEDAKYSVINESYISQYVDDTYRLNKYNGKKLYILNPDTNQRFCVLPDLKKYDIVDIEYAVEYRNFIIITSAERIDEVSIRLDYYKYVLDNDESNLIYTQIVNTNELGHSMDIKVFALDEGHVLFESIYYQNESANSLISHDRLYSESVLLDITADKKHILKSAIINKSGIERIIPLNGNLCLLKIGNCRIEEKLYENIHDEADYKEIIGIVNIKQFISEIALDMDINFLDILDEGSDTITFPYVKKCDNYVIYSKVDTDKKTEEINMYDYDKKIKKVRFNNRINRVSDVGKSFVVNDIPYTIHFYERNTRIINLNTNKTEVRLGADIKIKFVFHDLIVVEKSKKKFKFFGHNINYILVYKYPDIHHSIMKTRAKYKACLVHDDNLLIFTS